MNRLQTELERLYLGGLVFAPADARDLSLADARGRVRAMVLEVAQPIGWDALSEVWHGVQMELELPAPAIAVSGRDGLQLWFSVESSIPASQAHAFLEALRVRFLAHIAPARARLWPTLDEPVRHAALVPTLQADTGNWSAFVAPDLAAVFSETPWLDVEPGEEGQAALLRGLQSIKPAAFDAALAGMRATAPVAPAMGAAPVPATAAAVDGGIDDPRGFLLRVMNDESVPLALRIEAAKALL
ncbi:MAG: hypothetical protein ACJ8GJ_19980 [Vitreoscilla sp.]